MPRTTRHAALAAAGLALAAFLAGCQSQQPQVAEWDDEARKQTNEWMLHTYFDSQVENAVTRQHTLWSHHFVDGTPSLNDRGHRDLAILARHYIRHRGGVLNLPRNGTPDTLYAQREQSVREALAHAGVPGGIVSFEDGTWTGQTRPSIRAGAEFITPSSDEPYTFHDGGSK